MSIDKIGITNTQNYNLRKDKCRVFASSNVGKIVGLAAGTSLGGSLVYSQMNGLKTVDGKKAMLEQFYFDINKPEDIPKRTVTRNADGKICLPAGGVHERSKQIVKTYKKYHLKWAAFITLVTTGLGFLADRSINAVNKKEFTANNK